MLGGIRFLCRHMSTLLRPVALFKVRFGGLWLTKLCMQAHFLRIGPRRLLVSSQLASLELRSPIRTRDPCSNSFANVRKLLKSPAVFWVVCNIPRWLPQLRVPQSLVST